MSAPDPDRAQPLDRGATKPVATKGSKILWGTDDPFEKRVIEDTRTGERIETGTSVASTLLRGYWTLLAEEVDYLSLPPRDTNSTPTWPSTPHEPSDPGTHK